MSGTPRPRPAPIKAEPETVVRWPLVAVAGAVALLVMVAFGVLAWLSWRQPAPQGDTSVHRIPLAKPRNLPPDPAPELVPPPRIMVAAAPQPETIPAPTLVVAVAPLPPPPPAPALPQPVTVVREERPPEPPAFKRRDRRDSYELFLLLRRSAADMDLNATAGSSDKLLREARSGPVRKADPALSSSRPAPDTKPLVELVAKRPDLAGLPLRMGADCQAGKEAAAFLGTLSTSYRRNLGRLSRSTSSGSSMSETFQHNRQVFAYLKCQKELRQPEAIPFLVQVLTGENEPVRQELVKMLTAIKTKESTNALARQALFDFSPEVREAAVEALKGRPKEDSRPVLLAGLRYPWAPVADHAAEALVALRDQEAVPALIDLLDRPDPCAPVQVDGKQWAAPQIVRINHLRNCVLCHAPSTATDDPVRGLVPTPGQPLPVIYYDKQSRGDFVRADVTYLRQDFSLTEVVEKPDKWPAMQRFDYLVRLKPLTAEEAALAGGGGTARSAMYPQREAVPFTLRELTGKDAGDSAASWARACKKPPAKIEP